MDRAYIPELGLSNKAIDSMSSQEKSEMVRIAPIIGRFIIKFTLYLGSEKCVGVDMGKCPSRVSTVRPYHMAR